jgi:hypothetical protein
MLIVADAVLPYPRPRVFAAYRDRLTELLEYLPNIRAIQVVSRTDRGAEVDFVNEWTGGGDIPAVARSVVSESMLRWTDHATWHEADYRTVWRTDIHAFPGAVKSAGETRYVETAEGTRLELRGDFTIDAAKVPGVPRLLAKSIGGAVETFMVAQIRRNTVEIARGVSKMLAKESAAS